MDFECSIDTVSWFPLAVTPSVGGAAVLNATGPGLWIVSIAGLASVRARIADVVNGSITVTGLATAAGN